MGQQLCVSCSEKVCLQSKAGRKKSVKVKARVKSSVSTTCKHIDPKFLDVEPPLISRDPIPYRGVLQLLGHCTLPVSQTPTQILYSLYECEGCSCCCGTDHLRVLQPRQRTGLKSESPKLSPRLEVRC